MTTDRPDDAPDGLDETALAQHLVTTTLGRKVLFLDRCASTNDIAATHARSGAPHGFLVVSDAQSGGRGRMGRVWHSPVGENLYLSLLLRPQISPAALPPLTLLVGAAVARALNRALIGHPTRAQVKWPNDLVLATREGPRKVGGILTEMATAQQTVRHVIVGIGINVNTASFPDELADLATSLRKATGAAHDRAALLAFVLNELEPDYEQFLTAGARHAVHQWREHALLGYSCRVQADGGAPAIQGIARDVDADGALVVEDAQGVRHHVRSGEAATITAGWSTPVA